MKSNLLIDASISLEKNCLIDKIKDKNILVKHFLVKDKKINYNEGDYFTISFDDVALYQNYKIIEKHTKLILKTFLKKYHKGGTILIIGLGNSSIIGDSFGVKSLENIMATNQYNDIYTIPKVALFSPETTNKTGISSFKLIKMVVNDMKPDVIILIDSLITNNKENLNRSIEINDCGIIYADAILDNKSITKKTFNVPVLSIGYPTLLKDKNMYLTKLNLEADLKIICDVVANSINKIIMS